MFFSLKPMSSKAVFLTAALIIPIPAANAANCISGQAAEAGYNSAYDRAKNEIDTLKKSESSVNSEWSKCLGSISGSVGTPSFPNLSDVWEQVKKRACNVARGAVDEQLSVANRNIDEVYSKIPTSTSNEVTGTIRGNTGSGGTGINRGSHVSTSDYYTSIWQ